MSTDTSRPPMEEPEYYEDEISLGDVILRLWRRRVIVVAGPVLGVLLALIFSLLSSSGLSAPVVYHVELRGVANGQYQNGVQFSSQDLLLPEILTAVRAELGIEAPVGDLRDALTVEFGSPMAEAVVNKFRARLQNRDLDPAQIDALNADFAEELRATTRRGLRIEVDYRLLGLSERAGEQIAQALPEAWSRVFLERFKIFLPVALPSPTSAGYEFGDLSETSEILIAETTMRNIDQGLRMLEQDNRLTGLVTPAGNSFGDLQRELRDFQMIYFAPIYGSVFADLDLLTRAHVRDTELELRELDLRIDELNTALSDIQRFRRDAAAERSPSAGSDASDVLQLDDSSLRQIITLATQGQLADYFSATLDERRELAQERADLMTRIGRMQPVGSSTQREEAAGLRDLARQGLNRIVGEYRALVEMARQKLQQEQGLLFDPLGVPEVQGSLLSPRLALLLAAAMLAGLLLSSTLALVLPAGVLDRSRFVSK